MNLQASSFSPQSAGSSFHPIVELRQYTLQEGGRDTLIDLFERHFIEPQEELGMKVIGTFRDLDRPNRFVWLRGFADMDSRLEGLTAFYGGPVWKAHCQAANATMIDSDNVLLLRAPTPSAGFSAKRPTANGQRRGGLIVATICHFEVSPTEAVGIFESQAKAQLEGVGAAPLAWFVTATSPNNFPRLPVREGEMVLVWFARYADADDYSSRRSKVEEAMAPLQPIFARPPEMLLLAPTSRSELR